ncbi:MAG: formate dehydrogenase subunit gamma [Betaproteobacteria bacterium]|nr:formate dehydrogenase subunit gamma [Betaproteobacteria bacterium]MBI3055004.1 formate dehydrogenase subunit gamma [Betaproteobacteria bacterium]
MPGHRDTRTLVSLLFVLCIALFAPAAWAAEGSAKQAERQATQPLNNAPFWRDVRGGENPYQTTQVRGIETNVLVQTEGQTWREIHNGPLPLYGGLLLIAMLLLIFGYYRWKGPLRVHENPTGRLIERFSDWERLVHWSAAISFVILAVSGLILMFGKYVLLPMFGYTLFSWLAIIGKNLHNFIGPLFIFCTLVMFTTYVKDNLWRAADFIWLKKAGGLLSGEHVPSGRFNAGEKVWFWFGVTLLGLVSGVTGLVLDFPNFDQGRSVMQLVNVVHAISAVLFIALAVSHIYIGTLGANGAYEAMRTGYVDETWAKEHHQTWYEEVKAGKARQRFADDVPAEIKTQVAQATKA